MRLKPFMGGLSLIASVPLMGLVTSPPTPSQANVGISVNAAQTCVWYMENLPSVINMQSATKYKGQPISVSATISPAIGFSGNPEVPGYSTECSFFNSSFTTKTLQVAIDSSQFVATYGGTRDESLSFGLDQRPLSVQVSNVEQSCQAVTGMPLTIPTDFGWGNNKSDVSIALEVIAYSDVPNYGVKNFFPTGTAARCAPELEFGVEISSAQSGPPAGAGLTYIFTGPSITFSMGDPAPTYDSVEVQAQNAFRDLAADPVATYTVDTFTTSKRFYFSTASAAQFYAGSLDGKPADFRIVPLNGQWTIGNTGWAKDTVRNGLSASLYFNRDNKNFYASVSVGYRIDYRYPGTDWVIGAATGSRVSNKLQGRVN